MRSGHCHMGGSPQMAAWGDRTLAYICIPATREKTLDCIKHGLKSMKSGFKARGTQNPPARLKERAGTGHGCRAEAHN